MVKGRFIFYGVLLTCLVVGSFFSIFYLFEMIRFDQEIVETTSVTESTPEHHFILISEELEHEYWKFVESGAKEAEQENDVFVEYTGPQNSNPEEQVKLFEMAIAKKVDGIIVQALNDEMFTPLIDQAIESGIPVMTIDTDEPNSSRLSYIGTDNYQAGQLAGQALIEDADETLRVGIIANSFTSTHQIERIQGFMDTIEEERNIEIVAMEDSKNSRIAAAEKADKILKEHPRVNAFYGTSALDGLGIAARLSAVDREDLYIIAFDTLDESLDLLERGIINAIVSQEPYEMGYRSVGIMLDIINGKDVEDVYHTSTRIIRNQ